MRRDWWAQRLHTNIVYARTRHSIQEYFPGSGDCRNRMPEVADDLNGWIENQGYPISPNRRSKQRPFSNNTRHRWSFLDGEQRGTLFKSTKGHSHAYLHRKSAVLFLRCGLAVCLSSCHQDVQMSTAVHDHRHRMYRLDACSQGESEFPSLFLDYPDQTPSNAISRRWNKSSFELGNFELTYFSGMGLVSRLTTTVTNAEMKKSTMEK